MKLNLDYVSNIIGETYRKWKPRDIVIIEAQTGTGKNYYISWFPFSISFSYNI